MLTGRLCHAWPGSGLFGDCHCARAALLHDGIEMAQEAGSFEVFAPAVNIWNPFASLAAVVAVEHRCDGVDAQAIHVEVLEPVERARNEEPLNLAPAKVVDQRVPVLMEALARVLMLV